MAADLQEQQLALWQKWRGGDEAARTELMKSLEPLIVSYINRYTRTPIPQIDIKARAYLLAQKALETYDPSKAAIGTHVQNNLAPLQRYVAARQNPTYLPEHVSKLFGQVSRAKDDFYTQHGRNPSVSELAKTTGIDEDTVERIEMGLQPATLVSSIADEAETEGDVYRALRAREMDSIRFLRAELEGMERKAFDRFFRAAKKGVSLKPAEVAGDMDLDIDQIYNWRKGWNERLRNV
jgi:DNA-directed RNA polymerase specialized sigma subunit